MLSYQPEKLSPQSKCLRSANASRSIASQAYVTHGKISDFRPRGLNIVAAMPRRRQNALNLTPFTSLIVLCITINVLVTLKLSFADSNSDIVPRQLSDGFRLLWRRNNSASNVCRVAISNSKEFHYEILESIVRFMPLESIRSPDGNEPCSRQRPQNETLYVFDFHIVACCNSTKRAESWADYYRQELENMVVTVDGVRRQYGPLIVHDTSKRTNRVRMDHCSPPSEMYPVYSAVIEATCYCDSGNFKAVRWLNRSRAHSCLFHDECPLANELFGNRAIWVSPHHPRYLLPTALPKAERLTSPRQRQQVCVIGATERRNFRLLAAYLDQSSNSTSFHVAVFGAGDFPGSLLPHGPRIHQIDEPGFVSFHRRIVQECDALLGLITKEMNVDYFLGNTSLKKLSGTVPVAIHYKLPLVIHKELAALYGAHWTAPIFSHEDDVASFATAMNEMTKHLNKEIAYG